MPDIHKLLWPKSVAIVGASSDTRGLRGRIVQIMKGHPYQGAIYPVSRSETEVQGLKAYKTVADLPPTDLAAFIEEDEGNRATLEEQLRFATLIAPKVTIQGGTTEVLRGIIARGLGLR